MNAPPSQTSEQYRPQAHLYQRIWFWGFLLIALVFIAYARVFNAGFIWDDESHLTQNPCIVGPLGLKEVWTTTRAVYYPLVLTTFWALHKVVGLTPWPYHFLNVLLHAGSAILLWRILRQLNVRGAWLGTALWALHPVMVQSVVWVTELKNTQSGFFYLLSIFYFLDWERCSRRPAGDARASHPPSQGSGAAGREAATDDPRNQGRVETKSFSSSPARRSPGAGGSSSSLSRIRSIENEDEAEKHPRNRRYLFFALSLLFFILATLSKPSVVMLPVVLGLCVWWQSRLRQGYGGQAGICWRDVAALVPFALISAVASVWTIFEQKFHAGAIGAEWAQTWPERFIIAGRAIWFYLAKLVWPHPLVFLYPRWEIDSSHLIAYLPLLAALAGLGLIWSAATRRRFKSSPPRVRPVADADMSAQSEASWSRAIFFAAAYYVISLFPVLGFFDVFFFRYSFVSDHFQYLASMGPLALAGAGIAVAASLWEARASPAGRRLQAGAPVTLQGAAVSQPPCGLARLRQGYGAAGKAPFLGICVLLLSLVFSTWRQTAIYHDLVTLYTSTLTKNPGCWMAHYNLGIVLNGRGKTDEAIAHYQQAIELRPGYAEAHYNLGRLLAQKGQLDGAVTHYEKALEINPADAEAQNNLGVTLFGSGRVDEAIAHYQDALKIRPDYADASCNLANALLSKGDLDGAIARYSACLAVSPNQPEAQYDLAGALLRKARTDEAIMHYKKVLELRPDSADAYANLGSAFLAKGRVRDAIAAYRNARRVSPENVPAQSNLAWLLATSSDPSLRNGSEAVLLAEQADSESSRSENHPIVLRILAAAYAESGRFAEAKETAQRALQEAQIQGNSVLSNSLRDEIALYELGLPYHK